LALTKALEKLDDVDVAASVLEVVQEVSAAKKEETPPPGSVPSAVLLTHTHTQTYTYTYPHVHTYAHIRPLTRVCIHSYIHKCVHVREHSCMQTC